ncbi:shikimate O-hydroxycinnamoyltransferase [Trifolium repens]|nr:shikimate O-hydroxycinnamoyltransferase [Trifolium repens]
MEMELVSRETIKPSSPTPSHLRIYPLSFLDNIAVPPTRVQLVLAWIYKRAVSIMGLDFKTALFSMAVDLRKRMVPPLSEKCVGNIVWFLSMFADKEEMELEDLFEHDVELLQFESLKSYQC